MKFLVPVARVSLEDCERMAGVFAQHHCDTRQAGNCMRLARRLALTANACSTSPIVFQNQRPAEPNPRHGAAGLLRDLEMGPRSSTAQRRLAGVGAVEMDSPQRKRRRADRTPPHN